MRHRLHQIGTGCILPITLPLDAERIVLMIAHRDLQVRQVDLALEPSRGRNADMVETRSREYLHFFSLLPEVIGTVSDWERTALPRAKSREWSGDQSSTVRGRPSGGALSMASVFWSIL